MSTDKARFQIVETPLGNAAVVGGAKGLLAAVLPGMTRSALRKHLRERFPGAAENGKGLKGAARAFSRYFETGRLSGSAPVLDLTGVGSFCRKVYEALSALLPGETVTYAELARRIGHPGAHRAVGNALARNPLPVFIPCHRVLRSNGEMGGFTAHGGVALKEAMLRLEGAL